MVASIRASTTALPCLLAAAFCAASCASRPVQTRPQQPPAREIAITDGRVALRASAYVELHTWLAAAARTDDDVGPELEPAKRAYARSLQDDDEDAVLDRTTHALSACSDDTCASAAVASAGFGHAYGRALPVFVARHWLSRATTAWIAIEAAHAALGPSAEAVFARAASDLGVTWPDRPVPIEVVSETPPIGRAALVPVALATRGPCFVREPRSSTYSGGEAEAQVYDARILDCVLVHTLFGTHPAGPLHDALVRELGPHDGERAWSLLVIHGVAAIVTGWAPKHASVYRRSAAAVEPATLEWLAREWHGARAEPVDAFAARYVARSRELHRRDD